MGGFVRKKVCGTCKYWGSMSDIASKKMCSVKNEVVHGDNSCEQFTERIYCAGCMRDEDAVDIAQCVNEDCGRRWCAECATTCSVCGGQLAEI